MDAGHDPGMVAPVAILGIQDSAGSRLLCPLKKTKTFETNDRFAVYTFTQSASLN